MPPPILKRRAEGGGGGGAEGPPSPVDDGGVGVGPNDGGGGGGGRRAKKRPRVTFDPTDPDATSHAAARPRAADDVDVNGGDYSDDDGEAVYGGVDVSYEDPDVDVDLAERKRRRRRGGDPADDDEGDEDDGLGGEEAPDEQTSLLTDTTSTAEGGEVPVEPFNLNDEREGGEGYFDGETYVFRRSAREDAVEPDAWIDSLGDDGRAKEDAAEDESGESESDAAAGVEETSTATTPRERAETMRRLAALLAPRLGEDAEESVSAALRRYGAVLSRHRRAETRRGRPARRSPAAAAAAEAAESDPVATAFAAGAGADGTGTDATGVASESLGAVTGLADDLLMRHGVGDVYELTRGELLEMADALDPPPPPPPVVAAAPQQQGVAPEGSAARKTKGRASYFDETTTATTGEGTSAVAAASSDVTTTTTTAATTTAATEGGDEKGKDVKWEYRGQDGKVHGPYTTGQMVGWIGAGYFVGPSAVDVRRVTVVDGGGGCGGGGGGGGGGEGEGGGGARVEDLMADLESDDEDGEGGGEGASSSPWMRSDGVDFSSHL